MQGSRFPRPLNEQRSYDMTHVMDLTVKLLKAEKERDKLRDAIDWVLSDAVYKPPEEIGDIAQRWLARLRAAKEPT